MLLREHPLMNCRGIPNWPPRWRARGDGVLPPATGEVGVLTEVVANRSSSHQSAELFLFMEHHGRHYIAAVLLSDETFCGQLAELLKQHCGRTLAEIGGLNVTDLL
jgi:hypothetical protein